MRAIAIRAVFWLIFLMGCRDTTLIAKEKMLEPKGALSSDTLDDIASDTAETMTFEEADTSTDTRTTTNTQRAMVTDSSTHIDVDSDTALPTETSFPSDTAVAADTTSSGDDTGSDNQSCALNLETIATSPSDFAVDTELPNPFAFLDGHLVSNREDWACRREEIRALVQAIQYGPYPPKPDLVTGVLNGDTLTVTVEANGKTIDFTATITKPSGDGPFPAFILISTLSPCITAADVNARGMAYIVYDPIEISSDGEAYTGKFYTLYDTTPHTGNLMAWAWALHRIMDVLEVTLNVDIDATKIAAAGCRRYGKSALLAGAFDERVAFTVPCGGGSAGINTWRAAEAADSEADERETIQNISGAPFWFTEDFITTWENSVYRLPFDAHQVVALVAPRALIAQEGMTDFYNTNAEGGPYQSMWAARIVYNYLNADDLLGWVTDNHSNDVMTRREVNAILDLAVRVFTGTHNNSATWDISAAPPNISWEAPAESSR